MKKGLYKSMFLGWTFLHFLILPCIVYGADSNCITIPNIRFEKTVGLGDDCGTEGYLIVEPGTEVTYCLTMENPANWGNGLDVVSRFRSAKRTQVARNRHSVGRFSATGVPSRTPTRRSSDRVQMETDD